MKKTSIIFVCMMALVALAAWAPNVEAYSNYTGGCQNCHGDFRSGTYTSNTIQDPVNWGTNLHSGHQGMDTCTACHQQIGDNPLVAGPSGDGFNSCMGCHGRDDDANNLGAGPGRGAGLRQHHWVSGIQNQCSGCHGDSNPAAFTPVGENVPGARNAALGIDPCNDTVFGVFGSDNDGDDWYDGDDPDCAANQLPIADPNGPYTGVVDVAVMFDGTGSNDPDGTIVSYDWDFGDGMTGTGPQPQHAYAVAGAYEVTLTVTDDTGDTSDPAMTTATIDAANQAPTADPNGPYTGTVDVPVTFDGSGSNDPDGTIVAYDWDFGDGMTGTGVSPIHTYATDGIFTVTLTVTDDAGATDSATTTADIGIGNQAPTADPNGPYTGTVDVPVTFDGSGSNDPDGTIVSYDWDFGDGMTGTGVSPIHTYAVAGLYNVTLTVTDDAGVSDSATTTADIGVGNQPPVADPNGPYTGTVDASLTFDGSGSNDPDGTIVAYDWDFGDGMTGTGVSPSHTYATDGVFTVSLTVTDDTGDTSDPATTTANIGAANQLPVADPNGPYTGVVDVAVMFDGTGSNDPDGTIVSYDWDFGDGMTGTGPQPQHAYAVAGAYEVTLTVTDDTGDTSDPAMTTATIDAANQVPTADPNGPYTGTVDVPVTFDGSGSNDPDGTIVAYDWDFGDGMTGTGVSPIHTYATDGIFTVTLTVTDDAGATDSATTTADIGIGNQAPTADPNGPYTGTVDVPVTFDGSGSNDPDGTIVAYDWDFGDGMTGTGVSPIHTYAVAGLYNVTLTVTDDAGVSDSATTTADIGVGNQPPVADPNGPYTGTVDASLTFDGSGSNDPDGTIVAYDWDFGDGMTGTGVSPIHTYATDGIFTVTLTVTDDAGATDSAGTTADISPVANVPPVADPNGPYTGTVDVPVTFDGSGSNDPDGTIVAYDWDFGDGMTGTGVSPIHTYATDGIFTVTLTVTDDAGATDSAGTTADISPVANVPPVADPNGPYTGTVGAPVTFDGTGSSDPDGSIVTYAWDFGDGNSGAGASPSHTYATDGIFTVTLTVTDDAGATDSAGTTADISPVANVPPVADPNGPYTGTVGAPVTFDGTGSSDPDGSIVTYAWDFGDGNSGAGASPSHTYATDGIFTVTLTVTDDAGATDSAGTTADISPVANVPPVADPNGPYTGTVGAPVTFDGTGSSDPDGSIVTYAWDFGDGNSGAGASPSHTYATDGIFTVTLTVTDDAGATDSAGTTADISPVANVPPVADPNGPYTGTVGAPVTFDGTGSSDPDGSIVTYAWDFGDGNSGAGASPSHTYATDGIFTVTLTVTDDAGATDSAGTTADISPVANVPPVADPNGPYTGTVGAPVTFDGTGSSDPDGSIVTYAWDFGDGNSGAGASPSHTYATDGIFTVTLTVTDDAGATDSAGTTADISPVANVPPVADPNGPYTGTVGAPVTFDGTGSSDPDGSIVTYAWDFGDGNSGAGASLSHTYTTAGTYTVSLTVTDDAGASDSDTTTATIRLDGQHVDLDIKKFKVSEEVKLKEPKPVRIRMDVKNGLDEKDDGMPIEWRPATVVGVQNGTEVYNETMMVSDPPGDGHTRFEFPTYTPVEAGKIRWTAKIADDDPDRDVARAKTKVIDDREDDDDDDEDDEDDED